tara:strand:- start:1421 stop:3394 length:1974 start_codon:yes stop_codon:yes gene_type:complete
MVNKKAVEAHIRNLNKVKAAGLGAEGALDYLSEYKVTKETAQAIYDHPEFRKAFIDTDANVARQTLGQGTALGFGDELEGFGRGVMSYFRDDKPFGQAVSEGIDQARAANELYQRARPYKATALQVAGGVPTGLLGIGRAAAMRAAGLVPRIIQSAKEGAKFGAASGLGRGEGGFDMPGLQSRGLSGLVGAGTGAMVGAGVPVVGDISRGALNLAGKLAPGSQVKRQAGRLLRRGMDDDDITVPAIREALSRMPATARIPDAPDRFSIGLRDLARHAATTSGGKAAHRFLAERNEDQARRALEQVDRFLPTQSLNDYLEETTMLRRESANRDYGDAYKQDLEMTEELKGFLKNKKIQEAWSGAQDIMEYDGVDLSDAVQVSDGQTIFTKPTLELMDYIKQSLDDQVNSLYSAGQSTRAGRAKMLRNNLRDYLDSVNPAYKEARSVYAGHSAAMEAAEEGKKFVLRPGTFDQGMLAKFGDHEMESFRVGVADALRFQINNTPDGGDAVAKIFNNPAKRDRLRTAFASDEDFAAFARAIEDERQMALTSARATTGSRTAPMLSDADAAQDLSDAGDLATGGGGAIARLVMQGMREGAPSDQVAAELRRLLLDPANQEEALQLMAQGNPMVRRRATQAPALLRNVLAQQSPRPLVEDRNP